MEPYVEKWIKYKTYRFLKKNHERNKKEALILNCPVVMEDNEVEEIDLKAEEDSVFDEQACDRLVLRQALEILLPLERNIVILSKTRGCSQAEIAKMLRISQSKVSKTMKKALKCFLPLFLSPSCSNFLTVLRRNLKPIEEIKEKEASHGREKKEKAFK